MESPFGQFEPTVELTEEETSQVKRALVFFENVMNNLGGFRVDISEGQPLIVKTINGKRLELPVFEAAELDAQQMYGYPPAHHVPFRIDGRPQNVVASTEFGMKVDALTGALIMAQKINSGAPDWFRDLFK